MEWVRMKPKPKAVLAVGGEGEYKFDKGEKREF